MSTYTSVALVDAELLAAAAGGAGVAWGKSGPALAGGGRGSAGDWCERSPPLMGDATAVGAMAVWMLAEDRAGAGVMAGRLEVRCWASACARRSSMLSSSSSSSPKRDVNGAPLMSSLSASPPPLLGRVPSVSWSWSAWSAAALLADAADARANANEEATPESALTTATGRQRRR